MPVSPFPPARPRARIFQQGGVRLDGERISDPRYRVDGDTLPATLQVGRQTLRLLRR